MDGKHDPSDLEKKLLCLWSFQWILVDGGSHRFGFSLFENDLNSREVGFLEIILGFSFVWG